MKSLVGLLLVGYVAFASADQCPHTCSRQVRYYTQCGLFGWGRCAKYRTESYTCYQYCQHGGWSEYSVKEDGACNLPCGGGKKKVTYERTCTNPTPYNGGNDCEGDTEKEEDVACNTQNCPIDGGWTKFGIDSISECSKTCGGGVQKLTFKRSCTNPAPQYGGRQCQGDEVQIHQQSCNSNPCPIDGGWSAYTTWEDYDECSSLCGGGRKDQWRSRTCTNPAPAFGGKSCAGPDKQNQTVDCNTEECGDKCPEEAVTYIANTNHPARYYQCDNGVARRMECQGETRWDQELQNCVHSEDLQAAVLRQGDECDPNILYNFHPDCTKFVMCINGRAQDMTCPPGTRFNYAISACDVESNVPCINQ